MDRWIRYENMEKKIQFKDIYLVILSLYVIVMVLDESNYTSIQLVDLILTAAKLFAVGAMLIYSLIAFKKLKGDKRIIYLLMLLLVVNLVCMLKNGIETNIVLFILLLLLSGKSDMSDIFRCFLISYISSVCFVIISSKMGIVADEINIRYSGDILSRIFLHTNKYERHSLGFAFSNQVPFSLMTIYFLMIAWKQEKMRWGLQSIIQILNIIVFVWCGSRFVFGIVLLTGIFYVFVKICSPRIHYKKNKYLEIQPISGIYILLTLLSFLTVAFYEKIPYWMDAFMNFRFTFAHKVLNYYGIHMFGSGFLAGTINSEIGEYAVLDNGYLMLFVQRGIIFGSIIILLWTFAIGIVAKRRNIYVMLPFIMLAAENFIDFQLLSYKFIPLLMILFHKRDPLLGKEKYQFKR